MAFDPTKIWIVFVESDPNSRQAELRSARRAAIDDDLDSATRHGMEIKRFDPRGEGLVLYKNSFK